MATLNLDQRKVTRMSMDVLQSLSGSGAHPVEVIVALAQCIGRVVVSLDDIGVTPIAKQELVDLAIKQMATAIDEGTKRIVTP